MSSTAPALRSGPLVILNIPCPVFQILSVEKSARLVACTLKKFDPEGLGYDEGTLDTFTIGDHDIGPHLFGTFRPSIIGSLLNQVMKFELEIVWVMF